MASVRKMRKMQKLPAALREVIPLAPVSTGVSAKPEAVITVTSVPMAHNVRPASIARAIMLKVVTSPRADRTVAMVAINRATVIRHAMAINPGKTAGANRATDRMAEKVVATSPVADKTAISPATTTKATNRTVVTSPAADKTAISLVARVGDTNLVADRVDSVRVTKDKVVTPVSNAEVDMIRMLNIRTRNGWNTKRKTMIPQCLFV